jgi:hypothetical protein
MTMRLREMTKLDREIMAKTMEVVMLGDARSAIVQLLRARAMDMVVDATFTEVEEPEEPRIPQSVAYHEAGHVVALYQTGGRLGRGGVRMGYDYLTKRLNTDGVTCIDEVQCGDEMIVALAGWVAEEETCYSFYGTIKRYLRELRINRHLRISHHPFEESGDDCLNIAKAILKLHPRGISDRDAMRFVRRYVVKTVKLIEQHWASVERVAKALERRRLLSHSAVLRLIASLRS